MRVLNVIAARATWLFEIADLNPKGKSIFPEIIDWLKETYDFDKAPESATDLTENKGLLFKEGAFQAREEMFVSVELTVFNDGLVANSSSSTDDTEKFLENVVTSAVTEFSLTFDPSMIRRKLYLSELNVRLEQPLGNLNPRLTEFAKKLSSLCTGVASEPFEVGGLSLWSDVTNAVYKVPPFTIERRLNAPFNENRFYSKAPLRTDEHVEMLKELEEILTIAR